MRTNLRQQKGFTLIEVIAVLIIVGVLASFAGFGIVTAVQGYIFAKDNAAISEKAQLAIARINRELLECYDCRGTSGDVTLPFYNTLGSRFIQMSGTNIVISDDTTDDILIDSVKSGSFTMAYDTDTTTTPNTYMGIIVLFTITHPSGPDLTFTSRVYPRSS